MALAVSGLGDGTTSRAPPDTGKGGHAQCGTLQELCLHGPVGALEFRTERLSSAAAAEPQFPKELIPVAGGGGAEGRSPRRRKGREVFAAIPARESTPERTEQEKKDSHLSPGLSRGRGAEERRPGRMAEMGGEGPPAATLCLPLPEDLSGEDRQLSEQERSNLPSACAR